MQHKSLIKVKNFNSLTSMAMIALERSNLVLHA